MHCAVDSLGLYEKIFTFYCMFCIQNLQSLTNKIFSIYSADKLAFSKVEKVLTDSAWADRLEAYLAIDTGRVDGGLTGVDCTKPLENSGNDQTGGSFLFPTGPTVGSVVHCSKDIYTKPFHR
jgi:hypothetical protein